MVGKAAVIFFMSILFSSSKGLSDSCRSIDFTNGIKNMNLVDVLECIVDVVQQYEPLRSLMGSTIPLLQEKIRANPEKVAGSIFTLAPIVLAYQQSHKANELLLEAQLEHDDLEIIVEAKVVALLEAMNKLMREGAEDNGMENICKKKERLDNMTRVTIEDLHRSIDRIEKQLMKSTSNELLNNYTQAGSVVVGFGAAGVIMFNKLAQGFCSADAITVISAVFGSASTYYFMCHRSILTHQKAQEILGSSNDYAKSAEKNLVCALTNIQLLCA